MIMIMIMIMSCSGQLDTGVINTTADDQSPYIATEILTLSDNQDARWLVEYANATDVQFLFSSEESAQFQFSVLSAEGDVLWAVESQGPVNESYWIEPDCVGTCSFIGKAVLQSSSGEAAVSLNLLAGSFDAVLITPLP